MLDRICLLFYCGLILFTGACTSEHPNMFVELLAREDIRPVEKPFFWEVTSKNGVTSYLFGTVHSGVNAKYELPQIIWDKYFSAKTIVTEIGLGLPRSQDKLRSNSVKNYFLDGMLGPKVISPPRQSKDDLIMKMFPMDYAFAIVGQPERNHIALERRGLHPEDFPDITMMYAKLKANGGVVFDGPADGQSLAAHSLMDFYRDYRRGDTRFIQETFKRMAPEEYEDVIVVRNQDWLPRLKEQFDRQPAFVAVGAAHLVGSDSLVVLLRKHGYKVQRRS